MIDVRFVTVFDFQGCLLFTKGNSSKIVVRGCRNLSLGLGTKAKGVARLWAKRMPRSHITCSWECRKV